MDIDLREFGLSERETKVYIALLKLGSTTTGPLADEARLPTSKIYNVLNSLIDKGLASYVVKDNKKYFVALDPKNLLNFIKEKEKTFKTILSELKRKRKFSENPQLAEVFEGFGAIKSMNFELIESLTSRDFYYAFTFEEAYLDSEVAKTFLHNIHQRLSSKKIDDRLIAPAKLRKEINHLYKDIPTVNIKFTETHPLSGLAISKKTIINAVWGDRPIAVKITSEQLAQRYKEFFLEIWKIAKK